VSTIDYSKLFPVCLVCGTTPRFGFSEGIFIREKFVCSKCEQIIAKMEVRDGFYQDIKDKLKNIWFDRKEKPYFS